MGHYADILSQELNIAGLAEKTRESYFNLCSQFFKNHKGLHPEQVNEKHICDWLLSLKEKNYSPSSLNCVRCALLFFYTKVVPRSEWEIFKKFKSGKHKTKKITLSVPEVWRLLNKVRLPQNRAALYTMYLCGLRISECVKLQIGDIHRDEKRLHIYLGKGSKSRYVPLADKALSLLESYWKMHRDSVYIFPSKSSPGDHINPDTLRKAFNATAKDAKIHKRGISPHTLRHSYATHLIDLGVPIDHVRIFMGHNDISTTQQYVHVTEKGYSYTESKINELADHDFEL